MTFNNYEMIAETRSYSFRWRSDCRRRPSLSLKLPICNLDDKTPAKRTDMDTMILFETKKTQKTKKLWPEHKAIWIWSLLNTVATNILETPILFSFR